MEEIINLLQKALDISKAQDNNNQLSLTTDLQEDIEIFIKDNKEDK
jgi:predicted house-cleaning noncanonical NTP pyrophosphatase (MazG superfamily)